MATDGRLLFGVPLPPSAPGSGVFSGGTAPANTYVCYSNGSTITGDSGFTRSTLALTVDGDADGTYTFGRVRLSGVVSDNAVFAHYDFNTSTNYALRQAASGGVAVNAPTGQGISLRVNDVAKFSVLTNSANFTTGVPLTINDTTASTSYTTGALIVSGGAGIAGSINCNATVAAIGRFQTSSAISAAIGVTGACHLYRSASGGTYPFDSAGNMVFQSDSAGTKDFVFLAGASSAVVAKIDGTGQLSAAPTTDTQHQLGYVKLGYDGTNTTIAAMGHASFLTAGAAAVKQDASGATFIQSHTGTFIRLRVNGATAFTVGSAAATMSAGVPLTISDTTPSTSSTTGALVVSGGVGIAGAIYCGGAVVAGGSGNFSGDIQATGGQAGRIQSITADTTLTNSSRVVLVNATSGNVVITLPAANVFGSSRSQIISIKRTDASGNTVTVQRAGTDTINGAASETIAASAGKHYFSNGTAAWYSF